jgi:3-phenylpropionate/trans-cinnamate dioxygenase ferredoxin subunit
MIVSVLGRSIGVFNVGGRFYAMVNRCPHRGAELCRGDIIDSVVAERPADVRLDSGVKFLVCPWHGWEYELETGQSWFDPNAGKARPLAVEVESGHALDRALADGSVRAPAQLEHVVVDPRTHRVKGPYTAGVIPVAVEDDYVVLSFNGLRTAEE